VARWKAGVAQEAEKAPKPRAVPLARPPPQMQAADVADVGDGLAAGPLRPGMPQRTVVSSRSPSPACRTTGAMASG
jgi:hypothetical protein